MVSRFSDDVLDSGKGIFANEFGVVISGLVVDSVASKFALDSIKGIFDDKFDEIFFELEALAFDVDLSKWVFGEVLKREQFKNN